MPNLKDLRNRISSVRSTQKITSIRVWPPAATEAEADNDDGAGA